MALEKKPMTGGDQKVPLAETPRQSGQQDVWKQPGNPQGGTRQGQDSDLVE